MVPLCLHSDLPPRTWHFFIHDGFLFLPCCCVLNERWAKFYLKVRSKGTESVVRWAVQLAAGGHCECICLWLTVLASHKLPSWAGGASSPQYTAAYQPDAASTPQLFFFASFLLRFFFFTSPSKKGEMNMSMPLSFSCVCPLLALPAGIMLGNEWPLWPWASRLGIRRWWLEMGDPLLQWKRCGAG